MKDKVIVITGASSGIGAAFAELAAKRGARPVLLARRERELSEVAAKCGPHALAVVADVTKRADVERAKDAAIEKLGRIDVWINNAGRGITRSVFALTDEDIDEMMTANVKSMLYGVKAVLPHFIERGTGQIINVSTMLARVPFAPIRSAYSASKAAMSSLTATMRIELREKHPGIVVTLVHPGVVATDFGAHALHGGPDSRSLPFAQPVEEVAAVIADAIEHPKADVYTREGAQKMVAAYYSAEDMGEAEKKPPFAAPASR